MLFNSRNEGSNALDDVAWRAISGRPYHGCRGRGNPHARVVQADRLGRNGHRTDRLRLGVPRLGPGRYPLPRHVTPFKLSVGSGIEGLV